MRFANVFNIQIDFEKSKGAYLFDQNSGKPLLDLFGLYSSLPLGYNHLVFDERFREKVARAAAVKIPTYKVHSEEKNDFVKAFTSHPSMKPFQHFHYCCTGALAVEGAIKTAIDYKETKNPQIIRFEKSFHGITGYASFLTDRVGGVKTRLDGMPEMFDKPLPNPVEGDGRTDAVLNSVRDRLQKDADKNVAAVLVEPIQCTSGDLKLDPEFLKGVRQICNEFDVPLIFDEVQTGFGATGTMWYFEQVGVTPDILVFGKKAQVSGIMVRNPFGKIFENELRLEVTWNSDVLDMIRATYILEGYEKYRIFENVKERSTQAVERLRTFPHLKNLRHAGSLLAFDFETADLRDRYIQEMLKQDAVVLPTAEKTIRLRPHLAYTEKEMQTALDNTEVALNNL